MQKQQRSGDLMLVKLARHVHEHKLEGVRVVVGLNDGAVVSGAIDPTQAPEMLHLVEVSGVRPELGRTIAYRFPRTSFDEDTRRYVGVDMTLERFELRDYVAIIGREVPAERWFRAVKQENGGHWPSDLPDDIFDEDPDEFVYLLDACIDDVQNEYAGDGKVDVDWDDLNCCGDRY